jgi:hypothetical protein
MKAARTVQIGCHQEGTIGKSSHMIGTTLMHWVEFFSALL